MKREDKEKDLYKQILKENVSSVVLKRWPFNYHCGLWDKHKPDANGREYVIYINRTRDKDCGKISLIHELEHIRDDLEGNDRPNWAVENKSIEFYERNKRFVDFLWRKYVRN